jgi:hypothetical protein
VYGSVLDGDGEQGKYARTISVQRVHIEAIRDVMGIIKAEETAKRAESWRKSFMLAMY